MGERLSADDALEWGLINRVFEDDALLDEARTLAGELAKGPMSLGMIRNLLWESVDSTYEEQPNKRQPGKRVAQKISWKACVLSTSARLIFGQVAPNRQHTRPAARQSSSQTK